MIIPAGYAQVNLLFAGSGVPTGAEVTFGVELPLTGSTPAGVAASVIAAYNTANFKTQMATSVSLANVLVKFGPNATGPSALVVANISGTGTAGEVNPNTAALVRKNTNEGGRSGRGRFYWPGVGEGDIGNAGVLTSAFIAGFPSKLTAFLGALDSADIPMVLLHSAASGIPITDPLTVTSLTLDPTVATQRRRLRR